MEMSIKRRLKGPTPIFFKKLRTWLIAIGGSLTGFGTTLVSIPSLPEIIKKIGAACMTIGIVVGALGSFLTSLPLENTPEAKENAKDEVIDEVKTALDK